VSFGLWGNNGAYPFLRDQCEKNQVYDREDANEKFGKEVIHSFILCHRRFRDVTGFVLAGGASRRMGHPKHQLRIGGETLLARQARLLRAVSASVTVLASAENLASVRMAGLTVVEDRIPHCGPLGGIYTGLSITTTEYNLFLGCDLPFVEARFLRLLCSRAIATGAQVTVPVCSHGKYQPLCAVYRRSARATIRASIFLGDYKVTRFYRRVDCQSISLRELTGMGFGQRIFTNLNTPADYEKAVGTV
jgi:molybdenum cofactor guanylyltransferase